MVDGKSVTRHVVLEHRVWMGYHPDGTVPTQHKMAEKLAADAAGEVTRLTSTEEAFDKAITTLKTDKTIPTAEKRIRLTALRTMKAANEERLSQAHETASLRFKELETLRDTKPLRVQYIF